MTMERRARWTSIGFLAGVVAIGIAAERAGVSSVASVPGALVVALLASVLATMLFAFRCPHCHARQIRNKWDWWFLGHRCRECHQLLDGPALSEDELAEDIVREGDPGFAATMHAARMAFEDLMARAPKDPVAARQLDAELSKRIEGMTEAVAELSRFGQVHASDVEDLKKSLAQAQEQLKWCRSLSPGTNASRLTSA